MRQSKIIISLLFIFNINSLVLAQNEINYDYLEFGYGFLDLPRNGSANGIYLDGSLGVSERFYLGAHYENRTARGRDFDRYNLTFGFHTIGDGSTDFYVDARVGALMFDNLDGNSAGFFAGTRSAISERFELITKLGFIHVDGIDHEDGDSTNVYEAEVKGLYKVTKNQGLSLSFEAFDDEIGGRIGYRYSF